jgi:hypothetical protein
LRLNHPPEGKCIECNRGNCRYEKICFLCGNENHGAFQTQQAGKYKGQLKCAKHRKLRQQLELIKLHHTITDEALYQLFASTYPPILEPIDFNPYGVGTMGYNANAFMHHGNINGGFFTNNFPGFPPAIPGSTETSNATHTNNPLSMGLTSPTSNALSSTNNLPSFLNFDGFYAATNNGTGTSGDLLSASTDMPPLQLLSASPRSLLDHSRLNAAAGNTTTTSTTSASAKASPSTDKKYSGPTAGESSSTFAFPSLYPGLLPSNPSNGLLPSTTTNEFKLSVEEPALTTNTLTPAFHSFPSIGGFMDRKETPPTSNNLLSRDGKHIIPLQTFFILTTISFH